MLLADNPRKKSAVLFEQNMIMLLHILNNNILNDLQGQRIASDVELRGHGLVIGDPLAIHLPVLIKQLLLIGGVELDELIELQLAEPKAVVEADAVEHDVGDAVVLRVEYDWDVLMRAGFGLPEHIFFGFDALAVLNRYFLRVQLLDLLVEEEQVALKHEVRVESRDVGLDPEVAEVVQLHLLLVVPQQK